VRKSLASHADWFGRRCIRARKAPDPTMSQRDLPLYQNVTYAFETRPISTGLEEFVYVEADVHNGLHAVIAARAAT